MVKIRLARYGRNKKPFYRIVVSDVNSPRDGKFIERIGFYDPINKTNFFIDTKKVSYWRSKGAQVSSTVKFILKKVEQSSSL
jgi:small subunit ribosomal protein S16